LFWKVDPFSTRAANVSENETHIAFETATNSKTHAVEVSHSFRSEIMMTHNCWPASQKADERPESFSVKQRCATRAPRAKSIPRTEFLWPSERFRFESKHYGFLRVLPIVRGGAASCLTHRACHMQQWPVDQSG